MVLVKLPEMSEGRGYREIIYVDSDDLEAVKKVFKGKGLGVMGTELDDDCFSLLPAVSLASIRKRFKKP